MKREHAPKLISLLIASMFSGSVMAQTAPLGTSAAELGLSDYRHFVIYPHLEKALRAQKQNDEHSALREFRHIHQQAPDNIPLTLYLAEAYRHFGHDDLAFHLLNTQLKLHPQDARLKQQLAAIPRKTTTVTTAAQRLARENNALQRAIYLKDWRKADEIFARKHRRKMLNSAEKKQWFNVLIAGELDQRLQALQAEGLFTRAPEQLGWASTLATRGETAKLQAYLATHHPTFDHAGQETNWLYLISRSNASPQLLKQYQPQFATNEILDRLSWQLMQNGQHRQAASLLLEHYPFAGASQETEKLMRRLAGLLQRYPDLATPTQMARLRAPLPTTTLRQLQSQLPGVNADCQTTRQLLGDMSPHYDATAWNQLAQCDRHNLPGVALYALQQAQARQPSAYQHRAVAYQAYAVEDYATALRAWKSLPVAEMSDDDLMAAANTAQAASDTRARDRWLDEAQKRGLDNRESWLWLHAQRYLPAQPELALAELNRAIAIQPTVATLTARATVYREHHRTEDAIADLQQALLLEPDNNATLAALGYALWSNQQYAQSREVLEKALKATPDDPQLIRQVMYVNERLGDIPQTQLYTRQVTDELNATADVTPLTADQNQERYNVRRLHEDIGRRWTFNFDSSIGLRSGARSSASAQPGGAAPGQSYRSYGQLEAEYRLGRNMLVEGDMLSVYTRLFADTGDSGVMLPVKNPMLGAGLRWKPLHDQTFFLAVEEQFPLDKHHGKTDTMLRASASFFNGGKYSDEWHPNGSGWFAQNLYLDAAQYVRQDIQAWTADYRASWHQKVASNQTLEPYAHLQINGYRDGHTEGAQLGGIGVRWNIWTGQTQYDAWPHKVSLGLEYQRTFKTINQEAGERNNAFLTVGVHW